MNRRLSYENKSCKHRKNLPTDRSRYSQLEEENKQKGRIVWDTKQGIFGTVKCSRLFSFFKEIKLQNYKHFLDLGSGDGRAVLIASLFTDAAGIESDKELVDVSEKIRDKPKLKKGGIKFIREDFLQCNLSKYDFIFINPDKGFHKGLGEKLLKEMSKNAVLFVHNDIFAPENFKKGKSYWHECMPIIRFERKV